jgi:hypothetical protein
LDGTPPEEVDELKALFQTLKDKAERHLAYISKLGAWQKSQYTLFRTFKISDNLPSSLYQPIQSCMESLPHFVQSLQLKANLQLTTVQTLKDVMELLCSVIQALKNSRRLPSIPDQVPKDPMDPLLKVIQTLKDEMKSPQTSVHAPDNSIDPPQAPVQTLKDETKSPQTLVHAPNDSLGLLQTPVKPSGDSMDLPQTSVHEPNNSIDPPQAPVQTLKDETKSSQTLVHALSDSLDPPQTPVKASEDSIDSPQTSAQIPRNPIESLGTSAQALIYPIGLLLISAHGPMDSMGLSQASVQTFNDSIESLRTSVQALIDPIKSLQVSVQEFDNLIKSLQSCFQTPRYSTEPSFNNVYHENELIRFLFKSNANGLFLQNYASSPNDPTGFAYIFELLASITAPEFRLGSDWRFDDRTSLWASPRESSYLASNTSSVTLLLSTLSSNLYRQPYWNNVSSLVVLPNSGFIESVSPQFKQNLKSVLNHQCPNLKHLLLKNISIDACIEDYIPVSDMKLNVIYLWNCSFNAFIPIWSVLVSSMELVDPKRTRRAQNFQFTIPINGHATQIVINKSISFVAVGSSDLFHGLILHLGHDLPGDMSLDNISVLALLSSYVDLSIQFSLQSKPNSMSIVGNCPNLKHLLLKNIHFDICIENYIPISKMKLDLIYLLNCEFISSDPIWSIFKTSTSLLGLIQEGMGPAFHFTILVNRHTTQIVSHRGPFILTLDSPSMAHGLILHPGQGLPDDLLLDDISFLVLHPSEADLGKPLSTQANQSLGSIRSRCPNLKYLLLNDIPIDDMEGIAGPTLEFCGMRAYDLSLKA